MSYAMKSLSVVGAAGLAIAATVAPAAAGEWADRGAGSIKDEPAPSGRKIEWSFNIGATTDYVFRGISQTLEDPTVQGGADVSIGGFYLGVWASGVDFVEGNPPPNSGDATIEVDLYGGYKHQIGPAELDVGFIYYAYPGAQQAGTADQDYFEVKAGVSGELVKGLSTGFTAYYSDDYYAETGEAWTLEGSAGYEFSKIWIFTPSISGVVGTTLFDNDGLDYAYWNAGLSLAVEAFTFDFRYHDTDSDGLDFCADPGLCDERFVFSASVALP